MLVVKLPGIKTYWYCQSSCCRTYIDQSKRLGKKFIPLQPILPPFTASLLSMNVLIVCILVYLLFPVVDSC